MAQRISALLQRWVRPVAVLPVLCLLAACNTFSPKHENPYEMQQSALRAYQSGDDARAESLYLGLIRMAPNDPENLLRLGNLYARNGKPDRAAETYMQALLLNPGDSRLWYNLGLVRKRQSEAAMIQVLQLTKSDDPLHIKAKAALEKCLRDSAAKVPTQHESKK